MKDQDIYRWSFNAKTLKEMKHGNNGGTTYWCVSQIGVWDEKSKKLVDTYWNNDNIKFSADDIAQKLDLEFVANFNDLEEVDGKYVFNNYDDEDCIDISHPNTIRGGYYIKKDAKPSIDKKRRVLEAHIEKEKSRIGWHTRKLADFEKSLKKLTVDTHVPYDEKVYIGQ